MSHRGSIDAPPGVSRSASSAQKMLKRLSWRKSAPPSPPPTDSMSEASPYLFALPVNQQQSTAQRPSGDADAKKTRRASFPVFGLRRNGSSKRTSVPVTPSLSSPPVPPDTIAKQTRRASLPASAVRRNAKRASITSRPSLASISSVQTASSTASSRIQGRLRPSNESRGTLQSYVQAKKARRRSVGFIFDVVSSLMNIMPTPMQETPGMGVSYTTGRR